MRILNIIMLLLFLITSSVQAQRSTSSSDQTRTIEIENDNGDLLISFQNGIITNFVVNDEPVPQERYGDYQEIIEDFSDEDVEPTRPSMPEPPASPDPDRDQSTELYTKITQHLSDKEKIDLNKKIKIYLKSEYLKVDGKKLNREDHEACLDLFEEVYGHRLNDKSTVKFKKSKRNYSASINIVD